MQVNLLGDGPEGVGGVISTVISRCLYFRRKFEAETRILFCSRRYGSGYPNATTEGVKGRGFPFFFYPISYGQFPGYGLPYIYDHEYGDPDNKYRPGGRLYYLTIQPPKSLAEGPYPQIPPMMLYVIGDKPTLDSINSAAKWLCSGGGFGGWVFVEKVRISKPKKFKGSAEDPNGPVPEQAGVYYRGSSVALLIAGYNNTAQFIDTSLGDSPFPSLVSTPFFQCINMTIAAYTPLVIGMGAVPLKINAASPMTAPTQVFSASIALIIVIFHMFF